MYSRVDPPPVADSPNGGFFFVDTFMLRGLITTLGSMFGPPIFENFHMAPPILHKGTLESVCEKRR